MTDETGKRGALELHDQSIPGLYVTERIDDWDLIFFLASALGEVLNAIHDRGQDIDPSAKRGALAALASFSAWCNEGPEL